jgi:CSLREA domain-containing protein
MAATRPIAFAMLLGAFAAPALAANIVVDSIADPTALPNPLEHCTLRDAIKAANADSAQRGCAAGSGDDTILFKEGVSGTVVLGTQLPNIQGEKGTVEIDGPAKGIALSGDHKDRIEIIDSGATLTIKNLTLEYGSAGYGGAVVVNSGGTFNTLSSTFFLNSVWREAGAILNMGKLTVTNSTFDHNDGDKGGAIQNGLESATSLITNSTFRANTGGAIYLYDGLVTLRSTILAANRGGPFGNCKVNTDRRGKLIDGGYNLADDVSCRFTNPPGTSIEALSFPVGLEEILRNNGGPTPTLATTKGGSAIGAIPLALCVDQSNPPNAITLDQRGFGRPADAHPNFCDIGAFELGAVQPPAGPQDALDCTQAVASLPTLPNHGKRFTNVTVEGVTDSQPGKVGIQIVSILQDEPVTDDDCPTGRLANKNSVARLEPLTSNAGGRTYYIGFNAIDKKNFLSCSGEVKVCVPFDADSTCEDRGGQYSSRICPH